MVSPSPTVLIVDCMPANREQYQLLLLQHQHSYTILEASSGVQGLNLWQQQQPDVILLGYPLPDLDDLTFLSQLQLLTNQLHSPVILLIDQGSEAIAARAIAAGAQTYVVKAQLNAETLRIAIDSTITNHQLRQQLQQSQTALQESESRLKSTLEASRTGLWDWNIQTEQIQWSDNLEPLFGLEPGEFDGSFQMFADRLHPDDRDRVLAAVNHAVATGEEYEIEFRVVYPNGRIRWALSQGKVFYNTDGQPVRMVGNDIDITERKQTELTLHESKERLQLALDASGGGLWDWNILTSEDYLSPRWLDMLGYREDELPGTYQTWDQLIHPDDRNWVVERLQAHLQDETVPYHFEYRLLTKAGKWKWIANYGKVVARDLQGNPIRMAGIHHDIDDRKRAEEQLRRSEEQFRASVETMLDCFAVYRAVRNQQGEIIDFQAEYINDAACHTIQISKEQHLSRGLCELLPGHRDSGLFAEYCQVVETGQPLVKDSLNYEDEFGQQRLTRAFDIRVAKFGDGYIATWRDITDRKHTEIALQENEARFRLALEATRTIYWERDLETDQLLLSGIFTQPTEVQPIPYEAALMRVHPEDRDRVRQANETAIAGQGSLEIEHRLREPNDPDWRWVLARGQVVVNAAGVPTRIVGVSIDMSDLKRTEQHLQDSEARLKMGMQVSGFVLARFDYASDTVELSPEAATLYGLPTDQLVLPRTRIHATFHPEERTELAQMIQQVLDPKGPGWFEREHRIVWNNGEVRWLSVRKQVFFDHHSHPPKPTHAILGALDITDRKQAELSLQESEQKLSLFVKYAPVSVAMFDRNMHYLAASQCWIDEFHLGSIEAVLGRSHYEIFSSAIPDHWRQAHQRGLAGSIEKCDEDCILLTDDSLQWLRWEVHPWYAGTEEVDGIFIFSENITQRKQTEVALRENEQMLRLALTGAGQGIWDWNLETQVLTWDRRCKEIFGLPPDLPVTYEWHLEALHPDDRPRIQAAATVALSEHTEFVEEYRTFHPDGTMHWILARGCGFYDATGKPYHMSGTVMDITARKQAEIDLQERNEHIRLLYETTRDLLSADQPLTLIQSVFEELKGLIGLDVYFNYMLDKQQQKLHLISYSGIPTEQAEKIEWLDVGVAICGTAAQQSRQIMQANVQQSTDPKAEVVRSLGVTAYCAQPLIAQEKLFGTLSFGSRSRLKFTPSEQNLFQAICDQIAIALERSELFHSLQQQTEELIRANRVKDEFLAILSHELRSPLNPILGWAKLLQTRTFDATRTADALATIERNARLQTQLIDDLLDVAKILRGKLSLESAPVDLVFVIESAIDTVRAAALAKNIHLQPILAQIGRVSGDATRLQQVVWNLLSNAIKFTPRNGRVEIRLDRVENEAQITVSDTGKGIKPDFLPYIFESFRQEDATTTRQYGGLGLGLSIVRHLVEAHGGTIRADSPGEGQGATFTVRLPLLELELDRNRSEKLLEQELDLTGVRVLAVDDEPDACELLSVLLSQYGAEILTVNSAAEVLVNLEAFQPDVLISDIGMPNMDGFALIQQIRALPPEKGGQIRAIALTAYARQEDYQEAIVNGYQHHITKPLDPEQLVRAVMALVN